MGLVFKILLPSKTFHGVGYSEKKVEQNSASLIHLENFGEVGIGKEPPTKSDLKEYLEDWSRRNNKITNPQFHAILSCKGKEYKPERLKGGALEMMEKLGYKGIPTLIYSHQDTENNHVHIVTSRVGADGKKVNHDFEKKRSNLILNEILSIEPGILYKSDIDKAMSYKYSTPSQLSLLMERKGYTVQEKDGNVGFYKFGKQQGVLAKEEIENNKKTAPKTGINKTRALLFKYAITFDSKITLDKPLIFTSKPTEFNSKLTNELHKKMGLEFVFFGGKDKDEPYGYAVIDHKNLVVYKGSDVLKLAELQSLTTEVSKKAEIENIKDDREQTGEKNRGLLKGQKKEKNEEDATFTDVGANNSRDETAPENGKEFIPIGDVLEKAIDSINGIISKDGQLQNDTGIQSAPVKRKRKNSFF